MVLNFRETNHFISDYRAVLKQCYGQYIDDIRESVLGIISISLSKYQNYPSWSGGPPWRYFLQNWRVLIHNLLTHSEGEMVLKNDFVPFE